MIILPSPWEVLAGQSSCWNLQYHPDQCTWDFIVVTWKLPCWPTFSTISPQVRRWSSQNQWLLASQRSWDIMCFLSNWNVVYSTDVPTWRRLFSQVNFASHNVRTSCDFDIPPIIHQVLKQLVCWVSNNPKSRCLVAVKFLLSLQTNPMKQPGFQVSRKIVLVFIRISVTWD